MNRETTSWTLLFIVGGLSLAYHVQSSERGVGQQFVIPVEIAGRVDAATGVIVPLGAGESTEGEGVIKGVRYDKAGRETSQAVYSLSRTIGVWVAAILTLCVFSYLYRDNPFYKLVESIIVGVSAGYWIVQYGWTVLVSKVLVKLSPDLARYAFLPETPVDAKPEYLYLIPVILGCLIFCRLIPKAAWLGRWPLAFFGGTTAGLSVLSSLTYFYFSVEHKGWVGRISRVGIWVLMISFGASFALTVMGRITLLTMRLQFLFDDWLGLVRM